MDDAPFFRVPDWARADLAMVRRSLLDGFPPVLKALREGGDIVLPAGADDPLRPYLVLLVARSVGCSGQRVIRLASAVQRIHLAALLHDRLGAFTGAAPRSGCGGSGDPHLKESMDILLGDYLFSTAACVIIEDGEERIVRDMIDTSMASAEAQAALVSLGKDPASHGPLRCFEIVAEKLSLLLSLSLRVGAILGDAPAPQLNAVSDFGAHLGKALRVVRDLASGQEGAEARLGPGGAGPYHHPMLLLWEQEGTDAWNDAVRDIPEYADRLPAGVRARLESCGYLRASLGWARRCAAEALSLLEREPEQRCAAELKALVEDLLVEGEHAVGGE